jgi:hypothetical protein
LPGLIVGFILGIVMVGGFIFLPVDRAISKTSLIDSNKEILKS